MLKRIAIIGPECTGKSHLASALAEHFDTSWVSEYARQYIDELKDPFKEEDLLKIAKGQIELEDQKAEGANEFLFCDTNLIVIKIWSDHSYGQTDPWILESLEKRAYDFYLLADIDIPWVPDPQREHPHMRRYFFDLYQEYLIKKGHPFGVVYGLNEDRLKQAISLIDEHFEKNA